MSRVQARLDELGVVLPPTFPPAGNYLSCVRVGSTIDAEALATGSTGSGRAAWRAAGDRSDA